MNAPGVNVTACPVFGLVGAQLKSGVANALPATCDAADHRRVDLAVEREGPGAREGVGVRRAASDCVGKSLVFHTSGWLANAPLNVTVSPTAASVFGGE